MIKLAEYTRRRKQLMEHIGPTGLVILTSARQAVRSGDTDFPFRQQNDFYYLTGFEEPEAVVVLAPKRKGGEFILFNRVRNRAEEIWTGRRAGQEGACKVYGADEAYPIDQLTEKLPELLADREEIHYTLGLDEAFDKILLDIVHKIRGRVRSGAQLPIAFLDITSSIHEMRLIKSPTEVDLMRKAAAITAKAHTRAMRVCRPGMNELHLEAELLHEFQSNGARFPAYTSIVGSGANSCILHYNDNNQVIEKNSIVLIDAGCEYQNYASDVTRTFPANGRFSAEQRAIYEIVLAAQLAAIKVVRPGTAWNTMQDVIVKVITQGLLEVGILKGKLSDLIKTQAYFPFYMHKSGHWLGLDVHDVGRYRAKNKWRVLQPGMVLTVEPGIYISADIAGVDKRWHNIGIRIEDDVLVTSDGHEVLSHGVPKKIDEIEAIMKSL